MVVDSGRLPLLLLSVLLPVILAQLLLSMLRLLVLPLPLLVLRLLRLLLFLIYVLLLSMLLLSMLLLRLALLLAGMVFLLLLLRIDRTSDSEKQRQNGCVGDFKYLHNVLPLLLGIRALAQASCRCIDRVADGFTRY